jgi:enoyl-CoA hydratase/carnithine racemase
MMIKVKVNGCTGTIILDRAYACNALNREMVEQIAQAFDDLRQEKRVRGIVLTGAGPHFCSGVDLKELQESGPSDAPETLSQWHADASRLQALFEQMLQLPKPIIAAVDGSAWGAGFGLVLASDLVVASHRSTFAVPAPRMGLVSGLLAPLLYFRIGASLASQVLIGASELSAPDAKDLGFVHHLVASDHIWVRASGWVDSIAEGAAESIQLTKKMLNETIGEQLSTWLACGAAATATSLTTEAATEGLKAFVEKRPPKFP